MDDLDWEIDAETVLQLPTNNDLIMRQKMEERKLQEEDDMLLVEMMMSGHGITKDITSSVSDQKENCDPPPFMVTVRKPKKDKKQMPPVFSKPKVVDPVADLKRKKERRQMKDEHREKMFGDLVEDEFDDFDTESKILGDW